MEALKEMDEQIIPWFQSAAAQLLKDMPAEKAVALALAKITGNTELKVHTHIASCVMTAFFVITACLFRFVFRKLQHFWFRFSFTKLQPA